MKKMLCVFIIMLIPNLVFAVDGYKDFIFGMNVKEAQNIAPSPLSLRNTDQETGMTIYSTNIDFLGVNSVCALAFLDDKLIRVWLEVPPNQIVSVLSSLQKKYGNPSALSREALQAFDDGKPNVSTVVRFDGKSINLSIKTDASSNKSARLTYQPQNFDEIQNELISNKHKNDL